MLSVSEIKIEIESNTDHSLCCGCLASGRNLSHIGEHYTLLNKLLGKQESTKDVKYFEMVFCWECQAYFKRIQMFQNRIRKAQLLLETVNLDSEKVESLSNLSITTESQYIDIDEVTFTIKKKEEVDIFADVEIDFEGVSQNYDNYDVKYDDVKYQPNENLLEAKGEIKTNVKPKRKRNIELCLNTITTTNTNNISNKKWLYEKITLTDEALKLLLEEERREPEFVNSPHKCQMCITVYATNDKLIAHYFRKHTKKSLPLICDLCKCKYATRGEMKKHWKSHYTGYKCKKCDTVSRSARTILVHLTTHTTTYTCNVCNLDFEKVADFYGHNKELHKKFTCDYCNKNFLTKANIIGHIRRKHVELVCKPCNKFYKNHKALLKHNRFYHPSHLGKDCKVEEKYCVECDKHFVSPYQYKTHLRSSIRHRPRQKICIPCPECGKLFSRKGYMTNHYKIMHVKKTKHYCETCNKYFVNGYSLRTHKSRVHDKVERPKTKVCTVCGRAFGTNRTLINHMRTHTGERPFKCEYCTASFSQSTAMKTHIKSIHMKHTNYLVTIKK